VPVDAAFAALVARVGAFHVTDRALKRAQAQAEAAVSTGGLDDAGRSAYVDAVRRYFSGFAAEARSHLRDVDRRLEHANQVHFNLSAERGVAVKRIEATEGVLLDLATLEGVPAP
jgi:imidazolonepropionase-like amidohydrolase